MDISQFFGAPVEVLLVFIIGYYVLEIVKVIWGKVQDAKVPDNPADESVG